MILNSGFEVSGSLANVTLSQQHLNLYTTRLLSSDDTSFFPIVELHKENPGIKLNKIRFYSFIVLHFE